MAILEQLSLNLVELGVGHADRWKYGLAVLAILPDDQVATAEILEVISEGAEGPENWIRIPASLEFDSFDLDDTCVQERVDADWQATGVQTRGDIVRLRVGTWGVPSFFFP